MYRRTTEVHLLFRKSLGKVGCEKYWIKGSVEKDHWNAAEKMFR